MESESVAYGTERQEDQKVIRNIKEKNFFEKQEPNGMNKISEYKLYVPEIDIYMHCHSSLDCREDCKDDWTKKKYKK